MRLHAKRLGPSPARLLLHVHVPTFPRSTFPRSHIPRSHVRTFHVPVPSPLSTNGERINECGCTSRAGVPPPRACSCTCTFPRSHVPRSHVPRSHVPRSCAIPSVNEWRTNKRMRSHATRLGPSPARLLLHVHVRTFPRSTFPRCTFARSTFPRAYAIPSVNEWRTNKRMRVHVTRRCPSPARLLLHVHVRTFHVPTCLCHPLCQRMANE